MTQQLPVDCFEWEKPSKFTSDFIKNYDEKSSPGYVFDVDIDNPKNLHNLHNDLPFLPHKMKINKCDKLVCNLYDKNNYVVHISLLKQALNHGFYKLMCNAVFGKSMEQVRNHRYIRLVTTDKKRCQFVDVRALLSYNKKVF